MKFKGNGIVWNPEDNKELCKFSKGSLETENPELIEKLKNLGYKQIVEEETELLNSNEESQKEETNEPEQTQTTENQNTISDDFRELRQLAKDKSIPGYMNKTKIELQNILFPKSDPEPGEEKQETEQ